MSNFFILLVFLTYYPDVAIIIMLLFMQVVFNLNGFTYYLHSQTKHIVDIFGMTLEAISRPFNIESLKLFQFCCFSFSYCLICILLCRYYLKCYLCYVAYKKSLRIFTSPQGHFKVVLRPIKITNVTVLVSHSVIA